ncbi:MAG: hypothetical protein ACOC2E_08065 [Bacteroidota bacterium]
MPKTIIAKIKENPEHLRMKNVKRRNKKKRIKFKKITFKITESQMMALDSLCKKQNTTTVRYIKSVLKKQTAGFKPVPVEKNYVTQNQLSLFDDMDEE